MKHVKFKPDLSNWGISVSDLGNSKFADALSESLIGYIEETLHCAFVDGDSYLDFPVAWGDTDGNNGPSINDPLMMYLYVGLSGGTNTPTYAFNLRECVDEKIKDCAYDGSFRDGLQQISKGLRELSDEIDAVTKSRT